VVARVAKESGALVLGIVMLPFDCEGNRRARQAQLGLHELKKCADGVICVPNQRLFKLIDEKTSLLEAFGITNELVAQGVRGIWRLLSRPGLINVDFADLCAVTQGRHSESCLVTAEAQGENRSREVMEKLLSHPMLEEGVLLTESASVLICIAGGPGLTMTEVNRIMEQVNRQCDQSHLILGAVVDPELGDRLSVTLVASRDGFVEPTGRGAEAANRDSAGASEGVDPFGSSEESNRPPARLVPPAPILTPEKAEQLFTRQASGGSRFRRGSSRMKQAQLALEIVSRGRFEKSEPTIHQGQDLDMPTYIRRGVALN
jgi:cell division protein FtsZ